MKKSLIVVVLLAMVLASGCAKRADQIVGLDTSPVKYTHLTCEQITVKLDETTAQLAALSETQDNIALTDEIAMGVGLFLLWPALIINIATPDHKEEIAQLKGECQALEMASLVNCQKL